VCTLQARWLTRRTAAAVVALAVVLTVPARASADTRRRIVSQGMRRSYLLHLPTAYDGVRPLPVVLNFHGAHGLGSAQRRLTGFNALADAAGFIVVYPNGIRRHWHDDRAVFNTDIDDVGFVSDVLDDLGVTYAVDPRRVYATGISNGGCFVFSLACRLSTRIAAAAATAAAMPAALPSTCRPEHPISMMMINGTLDWLIPPRGGVLGIRGERGTVLSTEESIGFWRTANACGEPAINEAMPDVDNTDGTTVWERAYRGCGGGTEVTLYTVLGGGHTWPGGRQYLPVRLVGRTSRDLNASETMWRFFQAHALP
jgi:polyhydroxybutyrate depolymerase